MVCVSLIFNFQFSIFNPLHSQETVSPLTSWVATVDENSQQIVLSWLPSADSNFGGYHICTGTPCLDYDTVFNRYDTSYVCVDHAPTEPHTYRIHVFDSAYSPSALTPSFGNMVLSAEVPQCATEVNVSWTPYQGMPGGLALYSLWARLEPYYDDYVEIFSIDSAGPCSYRFDISEGVTRVWLKVKATPAHNAAGFSRISQSNVVSVERSTVDTAVFFDISAVEYDSINIRNILTLSVDTSYHESLWYLWRSIDGSPWRLIDSLTITSLPCLYYDTDINPFDSLHCYQLSVRDACGLNERYSSTGYVVVPTPQPPASAFPNVLVAGDPANGTFRPVLRGLKGNLYELYIYNRLGLLVFSTTDPAAEWTPAANSPQGVYTYSLRCRFNNNQVKTYTGTILVLK